jgi:eukaryotic-like serine/threonine-protein kinase
MVMAEFITCPQGHQWEPSALPTTDELLCPVCGWSSPAAPVLRPGAAADQATQVPGTVLLSPSSSANTATAVVPPEWSRLERKTTGLIQIDGFEILEELGRGGMGVVYKARQKNLNRLVALKMLLGEVQPGASNLARFRLEAEALAQLRHPNMVQIYDVGEQAGRPFFVLELIEGGSLSRKLGGQPQPPRAAAQLVQTLARAVQQAHHQGIIHRDLKPANVLLQGGDPHATGCDLQSVIPKISDFGLAKRLNQESNQTRTGTILGTPSYMAPEQAGGKGKAIGPAADIYALGALLYELLTGQPPFRSENPLETVFLVISQEPVPPRRLQPKVPHDLETICLKCLQKAPAQRYASADDLADDLGRFLAGEPIRARRTSAAQRFGKWVKRKPAVAALLALGLLAVVWTGFVHGPTVFRLATNQGRLALATSHPEVKVHVQRAGAEVAVLDGENPTITLPAGDYELVLAEEPPGLELSADHVTLGRNSLGTVDVRVQKVGELGHFDGHRGPVRALAISPDGRFALSGSGDPGGDQTLRLWDMGDGKELRRFGDQHGDVRAVAFAPRGSLALSGGSDNKMHLWDVNRGKKEVRRFEGHAGAVTAVAFSPSGLLAVSASEDKTLRIWEVASGKEVSRCLGHTAAVTSAVFRGDGQAVLSASADQTLRLWAVATGKEVRRFASPYAALTGVALSPDGRLALSGGVDKMVLLWDVETGKRLRRFIGHLKMVTAVAFSPDGRQAVSSSLDRTVRVWNLASGQEVRRLLHNDGVLTIACAPHEHRLLAAGGANLEGPWVKGRDFALRVWPLPKADKAPLDLAKLRLLAETDDTVGQVLLLGEHEDFFTARFSPDGRLAVSAGGGELTLDTNEWVAGHDFDVRIWDIKTGAELGRLKHPAGVFAVFAPDSRRVLTTSDKSIRIWDVKTRKEQFKYDYDFSVGWAAWAPDGKRWFIACGDWKLRLFDAATGKALRTFSGHTHPGIESVAFAPDGKRACSSGFDGTVRVWDLDKGTEKVLQSDGFRVRQAVWSPDGRNILAGGANKLVQLWDVETGQLVRRFQGHTHYVESVSFSPDGRRALSASIDGTIRLWDVKTGAELHRFEKFQVKNRHQTIVHIVFSPDGRSALSSGWDKTLRLWRLPK